MGVTRRQFLQLTGTSAVGAVAFAACAPAKSEITVPSTARMPEDLVTGIDTWYASICRMCPSGCGIIIRVMEGRAKKIEGNPDYPVNRGKLCARGQAGLQALYHPDRIRGPLRRTGPRGSGRFESISWEAGLEELVGKLKEAQASGDQGRTLVAMPPLRGHLGLVLHRLEQAMGGNLHVATFEALDAPRLAWALTPAGSAAVGFLEVAKARFILSFGADFLNAWLSPVQYGVAYGQFRGRPGARGVLVQVEPRLTGTGAAADQWIPIKPGSEGYLALAMARVIIQEGLGNPAVDRGLDAVTRDFQPEAAARLTEVPADRIAELARRFATQRPSLAIAGGPAAAHTNAGFNLNAINALNHLVGSVGAAGGVAPNPPSPLAGVPASGAGDSFYVTFSRWLKERVDAMLAGRGPQVLLVRGTNPVHDLPAAISFPEALARVPYIASFSSFMDETTAIADLILPEHTYLEDWGSDIPEPAPGFQVLGFQQPVVRPLYDTRSFGDLLLALADALGLSRDLPWRTFKDVLREGAQGLMALKRGSVQPSLPVGGFEEYWINLLQRGGWWDESAKGALAAQVPIPTVQPKSPTFSGPDQDYPFHLLPFPSASLGAGEGAHLPWLQAMPDPITTAVWMTWVEVNTETARRLALNMGDVVRVESPAGSLEAPVYAHPGIRPDVVGIPMGQGHAVFGRYAEGRGANVMDLLAPTVSDDGSLAWAATRVRLAKTGTSVRVLRAEGSVTPVEPEDVDIVGVIPG